jgi:NAD+ kinase
MSARADEPGAPATLRSVGVLTRPDLQAADRVLHTLATWLHARGLQACLTESSARLAGDGLPAGARTVSDAELSACADLVVVLGGDGTLLVASHVLQRSVPVVAVNFGSLGFLTEVALTELFPTLEAVLAGQAQIEERRLLRAVVQRAGHALVSDDALNDVVLTRSSHSRILDLDVWIDGRFVSSFRSDGLIVASPTGSTAYNLAAGGPILHPALPALVLTPICPHMLSHRPLVVPDQAAIEVRVRQVREVEAQVTFDGQRGLDLQPDDGVTVTRSPRTLHLVKAATRDYFEVLRTKLKWGQPPARFT